MDSRTGVVLRVAVGAALAATLLAACGSGNPYDLPEYGSESSSGAVSGESATATSGTGVDAASTAPAATDESTDPAVTREPSPPSTDVTYTPSDARGEGAWVERGTVHARTKQARAAVAAVIGYMQQRVQLSNTWTVDDEALAAVASGQAVTSAHERALSQEAAGRRSIGRFVVNVSTVRITGNRAKVTGCHFDATSEVDENGYVLVPPPGGILITMNVEFSQGVWRVTSWPKKEVPTCQGWKQ